MKTIMPEPEIITRKGKAVSVILSIEVYQEVLERLEDSDDIAWLKGSAEKAAILPQARRRAGRPRGQTEIES